MKMHNHVLYLGNVRGGGGAQRLRGDCLSGHQHSGFTITITIQLSKREEK